MKKLAPSQTSSAQLGTASTKFILTGMIAAAAGLALAASSHAQVSINGFVLDGTFSGGASPAGIPFGAEWADVTPFAFKSTSGGTIPTTLADPTKNTLLYAAISHNNFSAPGDLQLHLMYDFLPRTSVPLPGETFATVTFPVTLGAPFNRPKSDISVVLIGNGVPAQGFFDIFVDLEVNNPFNTLTPLRVAGANSGLFPGLLAASAPGPSTLSATAHLRVELEVPLRLQNTQITPLGGLDPTGTRGGTGGAGINPATGMYDPDPVFWGASAGGDGQPLAGDEKGVSSLGGLQNATTVVIGIEPSGALTVTPTPEPTTAVLLLGSLAFLGARRRRAASAA